MRVLLRWLVEHAWIFYVVCAIGALIHLVRALAAQRDRSLALFTLEHETATVRAVRAWVMVFVFVAIALVIFISASFMVNGLPAYDPGSPLPTSTPKSEGSRPTPGATPTPTDSIAIETPALDTPTPPATVPSSVTEPSRSESTPTPTATPAAAGALSGGMSVRFGDFGRLTGYQVSSAEVTTGEPLIVTLYWEGLEGTSPVDYTVFTHLLTPDGLLIAQHDGPPANGAAPTSDWEAGQTIQDVHQLTFKSGVGDYAGSATVMVGLYDPSDVDFRVPTSEGQDYAILPVTITVVPQ